jgi:hypothetical protein
MSIKKTSEIITKFFNAPLTIWLIGLFLRQDLSDSLLFYLFYTVEIAPKFIAPF